MTNTLDPIETVQDHLDAVSNHLLLGQVDQCVPYFDLPCVIKTSKDESITETVEDLLLDLRQLADILSGYAATHYVRLAKSARIIADDLIEGWYDTHILRHALEVVPRYLSRIVLRHTGGQWRVTEAEHALDNTSARMPFLRPSKNQALPETTGDIDDIRATNADAKPVYEAYLAGLDAATVARDFDRWVTHFEIPYEAHYDAIDEVVEDAEQTRAFFELQLQELDKAPDSVLTSAASRAQFIAADRIVGYHDATVTAQGRTIFGPVQSRMVINLNGDSWKAYSVTNALDQEGLKATELKISPYLPTIREIQKRMTSK